MKKILFFIATVIIFTTSCFDDCTFRNCPIPDFDNINALVFTFDLNTTYSIDEVEDAHIIRYDKNNNFVNALDTFYFKTQFDNGNFLMVLSDPKPFSSGGTFNLNSYENFDYIIRPNHTGKTYKIKDIQVKGEFRDCDCEYINTKKTLQLDGVAMDRTNSVLQIVLN